MQSQIEGRVDKDIPFKPLEDSEAFRLHLRKRTAKNILYFQDSTKNFVLHDYTLAYPAPLQLLITNYAFLPRYIAGDVR